LQYTQKLEKNIYIQGEAKTGGISGILADLGIFFFKPVRLYSVLKFHQISSRGVAMVFGQESAKIRTLYLLAISSFIIPLKISRIYLK